MNRPPARERGLQEASLYLQQKLRAAGCEIVVEDRGEEIRLRAYLPTTGDQTLVRVVWDAQHEEARFEYQVKYEIPS